MAGDVDRDAFVAMLAERYPSIAADIDESMSGLLHLEMGQLARAAQVAISDEDTVAVREHFRFIDEVYRRSTPEVKNAVHVSYLERLSFDGKHGKRIRARESSPRPCRWGFSGLRRRTLSCSGEMAATDISLQRK